MRLAVSPIDTHRPPFSRGMRQNCAKLYDTSSLIKVICTVAISYWLKSCARYQGRSTSGEVCSARAAGPAISKAAIIHNRREFPLQAKHNLFSLEACGDPVFRAREGFGRLGAKAWLHSG